MTALQTLLNRIKELDEKRTPGEWLLNNRIHADRRQIITGEAAICCFCCHWDEPNFIIEKVKNDAQFIATLANECAKLVKIIEVQSEALKRADELFASDNMRTLVLREAIEQAEKIAEGSGK